MDDKEIIALFLARDEGAIQAAQRQYGGGGLGLAHAEPLGELLHAVQIPVPPQEQAPAALGKARQKAVQRGPEGLTATTGGKQVLTAPNTPSPARTPPLRRRLRPNTRDCSMGTSLPSL